MGMGCTCLTYPNPWLEKKIGAKIIRLKTHDVASYESLRTRSFMRCGIKVTPECPVTPEFEHTRDRVTHFTRFFSSYGDPESPTVQVADKQRQQIYRPIYWDR